MHGTVRNDARDEGGPLGPTGGAALAAWGAFACYGGIIRAPPRVSLPGCFGVVCEDIMVRGFSRRDALFLFPSFMLRPPLG